ncbi:MAG: efflux transporter periplasmic adaptor subunit [Nevskia sp.]|nr:efflux transporter periplasmic adaptor subunit [Nevskia sp.]
MKCPKLLYPPSFVPLARVGSALALLLALAGCHHGPLVEVDQGAKVSGDTVTLKSASGIQVVAASSASERLLQLPGRLVWNEDATVRVFSPFAGRVTRILVQPGDHVAAGAALAVLSSADYGAAQADDRKAQALLVLATKARDRSRDLLEHGVAAAKDVEQTESDYANAAAEAQRAHARLKLFGDAGSAVNQLYELKSPIAGVVVDRNLNPGQEISVDQSGAPLFVITDPATLWVQLDAHEGDLQSLHVGQSLSLRCAQYPDERFAGTLTQIADFVDPVSRSIRLRGRIANADHRLKGEMYVSAELPLATTPHASVPASAVLLIGNEQYVFVARSDTQFERHAVKTEPESRGSVAIDDGLQPGENVVAGGALYLQQLLAAGAGAP